MSVIISRYFSPVLSLIRTLAHIEVLEARVCGVTVRRPKELGPPEWGKTMTQLQKENAALSGKSLRLTVNSYVGKIKNGKASFTLFLTTLRCVGLRHDHFGVNLAP